MKKGTKISTLERMWKKGSYVTEPQIKYQKGAARKSKISKIINWSKIYFSCSLINELLKELDTKYSPPDVRVARTL